MKREERRLAISCKPWDMERRGDGREKKKCSRTSHERGERTRWILQAPKKATEQKNRFRKREEGGPIPSLAFDLEKKERYLLYDWGGGKGT